MILRNMYFTGGKYVLRESLFLARKNEFLGLLEIEFVGRIYEPILCLLDFYKDVVIGFQLRIQKLSEIRHL